MRRNEKRLLVDEAKSIWKEGEVIGGRRRGYEESEKSWLWGNRWALGGERELIRFCLGKK